LEQKLRFTARTEGMASSARVGPQAERNGMILASQPRVRRERPAQDALYRETLQTTGRTIRILNRPKRVCAEHQSIHPTTRTGARRESARYPSSRGPHILAFLRHRGIFRSDVMLLLPTSLSRGTASRWSGPGQATSGRDGNTPCSSSTMSSVRLFLDRVARQQSPSPLHRHPQINMHSSDAWAKGDISTLPGRGHFYFALTGIRMHLQSDGAVPIIARVKAARWHGN
jgi:hypothetical protein